MIILVPDLDCLMYFHVLEKSGPLLPSCHPANTYWPSSSPDASPISHS
jgi:hypothetical protein